MKRMLIYFLLGITVGSMGTGGIVVAAGDPYEYTTLRTSVCVEIKDGRRPPPLAMVPGQDDPCFVRYFRYDRWLP